jgi:hypothetical protein
MINPKTLTYNAQFNFCFPLSKPFLFAWRVLIYRPAFWNQRFKDQFALAWLLRFLTGVAGPRRPLISSGSVTIPDPTRGSTGFFSFFQKSQPAFDFSSSTQLPRHPLKLLKANYFEE